MYLATQLYHSDRMYITSGMLLIGVGLHYANQLKPGP